MRPMRKSISILDWAVEHARQAGVTSGSQAVAASHYIAPTMAAYDREQGFELIIVGHVGRNGFASRAVGFVTRQLMESAPSPVLFVQ